MEPGASATRHALAAHRRAHRRVRAAAPARQADRHLLLLWPTLSALWLASDGRPRWLWIIVMTVGTLLMRSAGCAFNDWADRGSMRTSSARRNDRSPRGEIAPWEALASPRLLALVRVPARAARHQPRRPCCGRFRRSRSRSPIRSSSASSRCRRRSSASRSRSAFRWRIAAVLGRRSGDRVGAAGHQPVLGHRLRHRVRDGRSRRRRRIGIRTSALTFGRFDVLAVALCYVVYLGGHGLDRPRVAARRHLLRLAGRRRRLRCVSRLPDPRSRSR